MTTNRDATADLATCDTTRDTEWAYEFYSEALPWWIKEAEKLRDVAEANLAMSADLIAMEGAIKELRHELDRSRNAHGKAKLEVARLKGQYADEVDEFNAGYQAAKDGLPESAEPFHCPHDVWMCGYAWGKFESLKAGVERLRKDNVRLGVLADGRFGLRFSSDGRTVFVEGSGMLPIENIEAMQADLLRLRAEVADLRSREVIEHGGIYYAPLAITNGTWEWFDASEGICAYVGGESIPRELYAALPGVNLEKFAMAYPTREAALQALRDAIEVVKKGEKQP